MRHSIIGFLIGNLALAATSASVEAQTIKPYNAAMFGSCTQGPNLNKLGGNNPTELLGSLVYNGKYMDADGVIKTGSTFQPLALPIETVPSNGSETPTCEEDFRMLATGSISVLGVSANAQKDDVYRLRVRLIAQQALANVPEDGSNKPVWTSTKFKPNFQAAFAMTDADVKDALLFRSINIYLVQMERYSNSAAGMLAGIFGGVKLSRDDSFKGTKVIVTGSSVSLPKKNYVAPVILPTILTAVKDALTPTGQSVAVAPALPTAVASAQANIMNDTTNAF